VLTDTERAAVAAFPGLRRLIDLRDSGPWLFLPTVVDGRLVEVHAVRAWPGGWADAIRVRHVTDAAAVRTDYEGGLLWQREGGLVDVADALLELPPPMHPNAPRLVRGIAPPM
jgi:hypothetical protein